MICSVDRDAICENEEKLAKDVIPDRLASLSIVDCEIVVEFWRIKSPPTMGSLKMDSLTIGSPTMGSPTMGSLLILF